MEKNQLFLYPEDISNIDFIKTIKNFNYKNYNKSIKFVSHKDFFILKNDNFLKHKIFTNIEQTFIPDTFTHVKNNYYIVKKNDLYRNIEYIPKIQYIPKDYEKINTDIIKLKTQKNSNITLVIEFLDIKKLSVADFYIKIKENSENIESNHELRSFLNLLMFI